MGFLAEHGIAGPAAGAAKGATVGGVKRAAGGGVKRAAGMGFIAPAGGFAKGAGSHGLAEVWKKSQRSSPAWKQAWAAYCGMNGGGKNDDQTIAGFMNYVGECTAMCMGMSGMQ